MRRRLMFAVDLIPLELDEAVRSFLFLNYRWTLLLVENLSTNILEERKDPLSEERDGSRM